MPSQFSRRFQVWSEAVEARFGAWPTWRKLIVFMPVLVALSAGLVAILGLIGTLVQAGLGPHR